MEPREQKESKDLWAQEEMMGNQDLLVPLETEVELDRWACQDQKDLLVMLVRLERLATLGLQVQGD